MGQLPRLGKRELIYLLLFTCNYVVSVWRGFLFLWVLGLGYVILLWHSLSLPYNYLPSLRCSSVGYGACQVFPKIQFIFQFTCLCHIDVGNVKLHKSNQPICENDILSWSSCGKSQPICGNGLINRPSCGNWPSCGNQPI